MNYTKKRIFVSLISVSLILIGIVLLLAYYFIISDINPVQKYFLILTGIFIMAVLVLLGIGILLLVLNLVRNKPLPYFQKLMQMAINFLLPIALNIGKLFGMDTEVIKRSFIAVNNQLVRNHRTYFTPEEILILAPHCLQWSECPYKITINAGNCRRCGKCSIDGLHALAEKYGVKLTVASGGTLARKFIKDNRPKAVIAIACERDLSSGIQDTPLPVLGILNIRPQGPCLNTCVNLEEVEEAIKHFTSKKKKHNINLKQVVQ